MAAPAMPSSTSLLGFSNEPPLVHSVLAYGSETLVPDHDVCRLAYYLKCCIVGCGINLDVDHRLVEYQGAHRLPSHLQQRIVQLAFHELRLESLINRAFILDDAHLLLPHGTLNTFYEFKTASSLFSVLNQASTIIAGQQIRVHKVMLCTLKWMKEYYIDPFLEYQKGNSLVEVRAIRMSSESLLPASTTLPPFQTEQREPEGMTNFTQEPQVQDVDDDENDDSTEEEIENELEVEGDESTNYENDSVESSTSRQCYRRSTREEPTAIIPMAEGLCTTHHNIQCNFCQVRHIEGSRYHCRQCLLFNLCEACYAILGAHDQTHEFERIRYVNAITEPLTPQVQSLPAEAHNCSLVPDVPLAIAVPVLQDKTTGRPQKKAKVVVPGSSGSGAELKGVSLLAP